MDDPRMSRVSTDSTDTRDEAGPPWIIRGGGYEARHPSMDDPRISRVSTDSTDTLTRGGGGSGEGMKLALHG